MELGNQYGINMGNILSGASAIKTARLNLEKKQKIMDQEKAGERNMMRKLRKGNVASDDIVGTPSIKQSNVLNQDSQSTNAMNKTNYTEEEMQDIALNPTIYNQEQAQIQANAIKEQTFNANKTALQMSMPNATPAQIESLATQESKVVGDYVDMIVKGDENTKKNAIMQIDKNARIMMSITQAGNGIQDPQAKQNAISSAYTQARDEQIAQGQTPEQRKQIADSIPATYNPNWVAKKLAESETVFKFAQDALTEETKQKNRMALEKQQQKGRYGLESVKSKNAIKLEKEKAKSKVNKKETKTKLEKLFNLRTKITETNPNDPRIQEVNNAIKLTTEGKPSEVDKLIAMQLGPVDESKEETKKEDKKETVTTEEDFNKKWGF